MEFNLDAVASQTGFAALLNVSQQTISKQYKKGVLHNGGTYREWLVQYTTHLREEAAGRGGDSQKILTEVRIEETQENIAEKRQRRLTASKELVDRESALNWIVESATGIQGFVMGAGETIIESISEKYRIELDSDDVTAPLRTALGHIASAGSELAERFCGVGERSGTNTTDADGSVD
ncbi:MAG: hypothetical protein RPR40_03770 [Bermanella sp.]